MIFCPITNAILINHCSASSSAHSNSTDTGSDGDNNVNNDKVLFPCGHGDNNKNKTIGPNAMYRWASSSSELEGSESRSLSSLGWDPQTDKTLKMTINEIAIESNKESTHRLLSMEIIALRDIKPGEEVRDIRLYKVQVQASIMSICFFVCVIAFFLFSLIHSFFSVSFRYTFVVSVFVCFCLL